MTNIMIKSQYSYMNDSRGGNYQPDSVHDITQKQSRDITKILGFLHSSARNTLSSSYNPRKEKDGKFMKI